MDSPAFNNANYQIIKSSLWKMPPSYLVQLSSLWLFSVEGELWMTIINPSFVMLDQTICLSNFPIQSPGNIWCFRVKAFTLNHLDPNPHIASAVNIGAGGGQNTAAWSTAVLNTHCLLKAAEYFQTQTNVCECGTKCRTGVSRKELASWGDSLRCTQPEKSLGWKRPMEMVQTDLLFKAGS